MISSPGFSLSHLKRYEFTDYKVAIPYLIITLTMSYELIITSD